MDTSLVGQMTKTYSCILLGVNLFAVLSAFVALFMFARLDARRAKFQQIPTSLTMEQINEDISAQPDIEHLRHMTTNFGKIIIENRESNWSSIHVFIKEIERSVYSLGILSAGNVVLIGMGIRAFRRAAENRLRGSQ
jgi:hypothetical protein